jgi:hypothetical protein
MTKEEIENIKINGALDALHTRFNETRSLLSHAITNTWPAMQAEKFEAHQTKIEGLISELKAIRIEYQKVKLQLKEGK